MSQSKKEDIQRNENGLISTKEMPERAILGQLIVDKRAAKNHLAESASSEEENIDLEELDSFEEIAGLAEAANVQAVGTISQKKAVVDSATLFGKGKVEEIKQLIEESEAEVFIVDCDLTPAQGRNLEKALECRVIDRTELILDIFARRAQTKQAKLQVELAQLRYQLPRLKRMWSHLERQGGSIGMRGPGETQLETDKTLARDRISLLDKQLSSIRRQKDVEQAGRSEFDLVALVGYTNVGKSALLNALSRPTGRGVLEADMLFATLGATTRKVELGGGRTILLSDTVGLVRRLPHHLVESFHSTLAEVENADFLLWAVNAADREFEDKLRAVREVLTELDVLEKPHLLVLNQADLLDSDRRADLQRRHPEAVFTSALTGEGLDELRERIYELLDAEAQDIEFQLSAASQQTGKILAEIARHGRVISQDWSAEDDTEPVVRIHARLAPRWFETVGIDEFVKSKV
jgi:GTP-binding protein HflX